MGNLVADDALLMAYVDGDLSQQQRLELERQIERSPELARRVAALRTSARLPYQAAFARQPLPPVPEALTRNIEALAERQRTRVSAAESHSQPPASTDPPEPVSLDAARYRPSNVADAATGDSAPGPDAPALADRHAAASAPPPLRWLLGAFAGGAICAALVLQADWMDRISPSAPPAGTPALAQSGAAPWMLRAADYQQLYTRDTLGYGAQSADVVSRTLSDIQRSDGLALHIPDLESLGLSFMRIQRLSWKGKPLVQIVYLPRTGAPIALCLMKEPRPDTPINEQRLSAMNLMFWRQAEIGYALIGETGSVDLGAIARMLAGRQDPQLYSSLDAAANGGTNVRP